MKDPCSKLAKQRLRQVLDDRDRRIQLLLDGKWTRDAEQIPADAVPVDIERSTLMNQAVPVLFYQDIEFVCSDYGRLEMWSAGSQQHSFEVQKASPYSQPKRCHDCRQRELNRKIQARQQGQPKR